MPLLPTLLERARDSLETELGVSVAELAVCNTLSRRLSTCWEVRAQLPHGEFFYYLKWCPGQAKRELELTRITQTLFANVEDVQTPRFASCPTPDTFLVDKLTGNSLSQVLARPPVLRFARWLKQQETCLHQLGSWLAVFHQASRKESGVSLDGLRKYVFNRSVTFDVLDPRVVRSLRRLLETEVDGPVVRLCTDFGPHNVLVDTPRVAVFDFAGIEEIDYGPPSWDIAKMIVGLESGWCRSVRNIRRHSRAPLEVLCDAFLAGYGSASWSDSETRICLSVIYFQQVYSRNVRRGMRLGSRDPALLGLRRCLGI